MATGRTGRRSRLTHRLCEVKCARQLPSGPLPDRRAQADALLASTPMHVDAAITQLSEIHNQLLRSEVFRGYRSRSMAATAALAMLAATLQHGMQLGRTGAAFALFWATVAVINVGICAAELLLDRRLQESAGERGRALRVVSQLAPAFVAGAALPMVLLRAEVSAVCLLPGLWALVFGLAVFASRPFLPRAVGWVGLWYCGAGIVQLCSVERGVPGPWSMGLTFGVGQALAALVLHLGIERPLTLRPLVRPRETA